MSLATRCTACGTAFRIAQDQLNVSEGWVRCGRCSEVFNALAGLFDLERETPPEWQPKLDSADTEGAAAGTTPPDLHAASDPVGTEGPHESPPGGAAPRALAEPADASARTVPTARSGRLEPARSRTREPERTDEAWAEEVSDSAASIDEEIDAHLFGARRTPKGRAHAVHVNERDRLDFSDARFDSDLLADDDDPAAPIEALHATAPAELPLESAVPAPDFLRRAESRARWQGPRVRAGLAFAALFLMAGLALQAGNHFRDYLSVRWPGLQPVLAQWCGLAACTLEPPRRIEDITVESTALARAPGMDAFRLAVTLRSRGTVPVAMPWVDLSLTDPNGKLVARKALSSRDFMPAVSTLQPGAELALQTLLATRNARPTGYTVEIFYP